MEPTVTAVITTYKRPVEILERALMSVINQTYVNLDVVVVNDYPDDKVLVDKIGQMVDLHRNDRQIQYIVVEKNGGACKARNMALEASNSEYIAFLDDDDEWLPEKIEEQIKEAKQHPNAAIIYCNAYTQVDGENKRDIRFASEQPTGDIYVLMLGKNIIGSCTFPLIRVDSMRSVCGFRDDMPALQDWELYLRILKNNSAAYVHDPLAIYYFYRGERISANPQKRIDAYEKIHEEFRTDIEKHKKAASAFYLMGTYFYSFCNSGRAFSYYIKGVKKDPANIKRNFKDFLRMTGRRFGKTKKV